MERFFMYAIVCLFVFLAGLVDAVAGGGGLISLPAYMMAGVPVHAAVATNKMSACMGTAVAVYRFGKNGYIQLKKNIFCILGALVGSPIGARLSLLLNEGILKGILLVILPITAVYVLRSKSMEEEKEPLAKGKTVFLCTMISFAVGIYDGFYGPGTGTFLLLLLTGVAHLSMKEAVGTTKVINLVTNVSALAVFLYHKAVFLPLGIMAGIFSILGNYVGTRLFVQKGTRIVKPLIILVLCLFFFKIVQELFLAGGLRF